MTDSQPPRNGPRRPPRPSRPSQPEQRVAPTQVPRGSRSPSPRPASPRRPAAPSQPDSTRNRFIVGGGLAAVVLLLAWGCTQIGGNPDTTDAASTPGSAEATTTTAASGLAPEPVEAYDGWVDPASSGQPWSSEVTGQITFRGNPTRSYYGLGPVPTDPEVLWRYPESGGMCSSSPVGSTPHSWCGSGWTGQPSVWTEGDQTWIAVGTYDQAIHFIDAETGSDVLSPFDMGDIIKGSVTRDPDGMPLLYSGSRADFHILAMDRPDAAADLWSMNADNVSPTKWNDDWDSSPLVIDDYLFEGGENGQWYVIKLNRGEDADGLVTVDPEIVFNAPGWDDQLLSDLSGSGTRVNDVSIENSLAISGNTVYFANSGGLVQGWDISGVKDGEDPTRVFRFWTGDDTDASIVVDEEGFLYVASERERPSSYDRTDEVGQLMKLDPTKPDDPLVWSVFDLPPEGSRSNSCTEANCYGIWGTPAITEDMVYADTNHGEVLGVDRSTGDVVWRKKLPGPTWQSPVVVDDVLIQGDCSGTLHAYDVSDPTIDPPELWSVELEGCIESTPVVFEGKIYVGARGGAFYAIGDA